MAATPFAVTLNLPGRLKDAALAALMALLLAVPFIGLRTVADGPTLSINTRWDGVAAAVLVVFVGRLLLGLAGDALAGWRAQRPVRNTPASAAAERNGRAARIFAVLAILFALALPFMPFSSSNVMNWGLLVLTYILLATGLNVTVGLAGLLDLGFVAFYAIGAYACGILAPILGLGFLPMMVISGLVAAAFAVVLSLPILRLRGDYLAIVTLGFGEITRIVITNWQSLTGGPNGLRIAVSPSLPGLSFERRPDEGMLSFYELTGLRYSGELKLTAYYYVFLVIVLLAIWAVWKLRRLPIGRSWEALREDEIACRSLGINPTASKVSAYATGAMLGGLAGCFFAARQGFVSPESFTFIESALILAIVVLGGMGSQIGVVIAASFIVLLPEMAREFADYRMLVFGAAMILIMVWRPGGLLSTREPALRLSDKRQPPPGASPSLSTGATP